MMTLIDTSVWIEALRKDGKPELRERVKELLLTHNAAVCEMILLELWNGARGEAEKNSLALIEKQLKLLSLTSGVWQLAFQMAREFRGQGITVPATDLLIAACARYYEVELLHQDSHLHLITPS